MVAGGRLGLVLLLHNIGVLVTIIILPTPRLRVVPRLIIVLPRLILNKYLIIPHRCIRLPLTLAPVLTGLPGMVIPMPGLGSDRVSFHLVLADAQPRQDHVVLVLHLYLLEPEAAVLVGVAILAIILLLVMVFG